MRALGFKHRASQRTGLSVLEILGLNPTSFLTDWRMNFEQIREDAIDLLGTTHIEVAAYREEPWNKHKRQQARIRLFNEADKTKVAQYDSVKVIGAHLKGGTGKLSTGYSGYIMSIDKTNPARHIAEMSMDDDGRLEYIHVKSADGVANNLYRIDRMAKKKFMKPLKRHTRRHMLMWGNRERPRWETFLAARTIQLAARSYISYRRVARVRFRYWQGVKERRQLFLQTLNS